MAASAVNLIMLATVLATVAAIAGIFYVAATRRSGRKASAAPPKASRKVNPQTGDLFR